ncbi:hypothetical protein ASZ78_016833 [Callipepla squamata]|uniref:Ig-like domain-containing protein n=1 Tax=Callipepla squamata TaxID=9009 RepID=A0A226M9R6_CALSU|nr:hypothetical protein ASZ78_016833 [Callipepla squamata]
MLLLLLPLLALAEAWMHPFHFPWRLHVEQQYEAVVHTPAGSRLALLAVFSLLLMDGHAQVLLLQHPSVNRKRTNTAYIECKVEGIANFQGAYIHWYRHLPDRAPERILYGTSLRQVSYDSDSYKNKYSSYKKENKICILSILNIHDDDEGGDAQTAPLQSPAERWLVEGSSVTMTCQLSSENTVHWYRQLPGEPPKRILYMAGYSPTFENSKDRQKFQARKNPSNCALTIKSSARSDTGTYYCAYWRYQGYTALDG